MMKMKKSGGGKSADIRSYYTPVSSKPKSKEDAKTAGQGAGGGTSTKRKVKPVVEIDEQENFAPVKKDKLQIGSTSSPPSKKSKASASPVKKDKPSSSDSKSRRDTSKDKRSESKDKGQRSSGGKKRRARALIESDEDDDDEIASPMQTRSKKKSKGAQYELNVTPAAKRKDSTTSETSAKKPPKDTPDDKKKQSTAAYLKFLSRAPPEHLGEKEIPEGAPDCFANLTFVLTGVLPSFERDDIADAIKNHGGRVTGSVSKKTSYLVVGDEPGPSKTKKAQDLGVPMITEDDILDMLGKSSNPNLPVESMETKRTEAEPRTSKKKEPEPSPAKTPKPTTSKKKPSKSPAKAPVPTQEPVTPIAVVSTGPQLMWVDKYKPTTLKQVVGQAGNIKKLLQWLQNWFNYHGFADDKAKASSSGLRDPHGQTFKAALLSGPPGIGKTTAAHLCCQEIGLDYVELNASDRRNKNSLKIGFSDSLTNLSIASAAHGNQTTKTAGRKHVLIMDEVDGMSGNEDRGGIQELIHLIKISRIPIICICNDRQNRKIRSLANYCFDLRFNKPPLEQLKGFVQSICLKEKIKIPPEMVQQLIISTDHDVRQILHQLQLFKEAKDKSSYDPRKDLHLGPWEVVRKVFSAQEHKGMYIRDKQSLFFQDYSLGPLFVYENYLRSPPAAANGDPCKTMDLVRAAAQSLATGDRVEKLIRSTNNWSLLPIQSVFSSLLPGEYMEGGAMSRIDFPQWLGKNSNRNKRARMLQELHTHMHLQISATAQALNMNYLPYLRRSIVNPLASGEPEISARYMHDYCLIPQDLESLTELAVWPNMKDRFENIHSRTKAAFTRVVNKEAFLPYSVVKITKAKRKGGADGAGGDDELQDLEGEETADVTEDEDEDVEKDAMIKIKKRRGTAAGAKAGSRKSSSKSKKGRGADMKIDDEIDEDVKKPKGKGRNLKSSSKSRNK